MSALEEEQTPVSASALEATEYVSRGHAEVPETPENEKHRNSERRDFIRIITNIVKVKLDSGPTCQGKMVAVKSSKYLPILAQLLCTMYEGIFNPSKNPLR